VYVGKEKKMKRKKRGLEEPVEFFAELRNTTETGYQFSDGRHRINLLKSEVVKLIPIAGSRKQEYTIIVSYATALKKGII